MNNKLFHTMYGFLALAALASGRIIGSPLSNEMNSNSDDLACSQVPIEIGVVLDSSRSIKKEDFEKAKKFLVDFLSLFDIGIGKNGVRVSLITFDEGAHSHLGFNLTTYKTKAEILEHIENLIPNRGGSTQTFLGIKHMRTKQLTNKQVRSYAKKVALVFTDGDSQERIKTRDEAKLARLDNITVFAVGVGNRFGKVKRTELVNIAGNLSRVMEVDSFDDLDKIKEDLADRTCMAAAAIREKSCDYHRRDVDFIFSRFDLDIKAINWTSSFLSDVIDRKELLESGFRYGIHTTNSSCSKNQNYHQDPYNMDEFTSRLYKFKEIELQRIIGGIRIENRRPDARHVAVVFYSYRGEITELLKRYIQKLISTYSVVYIASPEGHAINIDGTIPLHGEDPKEQAKMLINYLCFRKVCNH